MTVTSRRNSVSVVSVNNKLSFLLLRVLPEEGSFLLLLPEEGSFLLLLPEEGFE